MVRRHPAELTHHSCHPYGYWYVRIARVGLGALSSTGSGTQCPSMTFSPYRLDVTAIPSLVAYTNRCPTYITMHDSVQWHAWM